MYLLMYLFVPEFKSPPYFVSSSALLTSQHKTHGIGSHVILPYNTLLVLHLCNCGLECPRFIIIVY